LQTEYEGQAKKYMDVVDPTDAIITVGGDGTVSEVTFALFTTTCLCKYFLRSLTETFLSLTDTNVCKQLHYQ